jgi:hypothetical protein
MFYFVKKRNSTEAKRISGELKIALEQWLQMKIDEGLSARHHFSTTGR